MIYNILCADVGGTNSRFAYFTMEDGKLNIHKQYNCKTNELHNANDLLKAAGKTEL